MDVYSKYKEAGSLAKKALDIGISTIKQGVSYLEIADKIEEYIHNHGGQPAFPVNISVNNIAAHYTPSTTDTNIINNGDVVKLDVGVHIDGYIGDTARTIEVSNTNHSELIKSAEVALELAISHIKSGIKIEKIGAIIGTKIEDYGFEAIRNLHGHSLKQYSLHAGLSIPNHPVKNTKMLKEGQVLAIEPFATTGKGYVIDSGISNIYQITKNSILTKQIKNRYKTLPFCERWLHDIYGDETSFKLSAFLKRRLISPYNRLKEIDDGIVSQAEHTVYVNKLDAEILTIS